MNDEQRAALAKSMYAALGEVSEELYGGDAVLSFEAWSEMKDYESIGDDDSWSLTVGIFNKLVDGAEKEIDRLLTEREPTITTTVPLDADMVERAARALYDISPGTHYADPDGNGGYTMLDEPRPLRWDELPGHIQDHYHTLARAALTAAGPEPHPDMLSAYLAGVAKGEGWLDAGLNSVHPEAYVSYVLWESGSQGSWRSCIRWPGDRHTRWGYPHRDSIGHGPTRTAAVLNAIAMAAVKQEGAGDEQ